ncbi:type II CAAX prenyl endopeptidase Rce1 family protein [Bacteroidota bacterium]
MNNENGNQNISEEPENNRESEPQLNPSMSPVAAAFFGLAAVFILYQIVGSLLTLAIFGLDFQNADINAMRLMTMAGQILFILLPSLIFAKMIYEDVSTVLRIKLPNIKEVVAFSIGLIVLTPLLQELLYIQNYIFEILAEASPIIQKIKEFLNEVDKIVEQTYGSLLKADTILEGAFIVIIIAVVPSICEEVFFRGYVQKSFELKFKPFWAALITALFFGLYHFNPFGMIPLILLGLFIGYSAYMSNSIIVPMVIHFLNNFIAAIAYFIYGDEELLDSSVVDMAGIGDHIINFALLALIMLTIIYFINNYYHVLTTSKKGVK